MKKPNIDIKVNMRTKRRLWVILFMFMLGSVNLYAYDTEIDGLRYDWVSYYNSTRTYGDVSLVGYSSSKLPQDLIIPGTVTWNEKKKGTEGRKCQVCRVAPNAFINCEILKSVNSGGAMTIGTSSFENCTSLETLFCPNTIISIGPKAFMGCSALKEIYIDDNTPPNINEDSFDEDTYNNATLYVPSGSKKAYQTANYWKEFKEIMEVGGFIIDFADANVKAICVQNWDVNGDGELSEKEAAAVTDLGTVFKSNTTIISFNELQYFTGLTSIGESAFYGCNNLVSVTIPNSVTSIGQNAFIDCI